MGTSQKRILVITGEASGDMRAAGVVRAIKKTHPSYQFIGIGGDFMKAAGVELIENIDQLGVVGFIEVLKHLPVIKKIFNTILSYLDQNPVDAALLVDYPGFNMRLAKTLKSRGIKVIYYVSPQVWAWKEKRVKVLKQIVDKMLVLFPFEKDIYAKYGMEVDYVGHPLVDEVKITEPPSSIKAQLGIKPQMQTIGLLPGSREKEITRHLPSMLDAAKILYVKNSNRRFIVLRAPTIPKGMLEGIIKDSGVNAIIYEGPIYNGIGTMDAVIVASGTATLECGLLLRPMVIMYKTAWPTYLIAKSVVKIPYIGLVNIVAGKKIIPELIQQDATGEKLAASIEEIFSNPNFYGQMTNDLAQMKKLLGHSGASTRAASIITSFLDPQ